MIAIEAKLGALMNKLGNNERRMHTVLEVGTVDEGDKTSMQIGATLLRPTSTYPLTTHQHSGTMRTSHMREEHSKVKDLDIICSNIMPHLGSNNNNNSSN